MSPRLWAALAAGLALAGCGKMGPLERPAPLFGGPKAETPAPAPPRPVSTVDRRDRDIGGDLPPLEDTPQPAAPDAK